jgi:hypothetical protein
VTLTESPPGTWTADFAAPTQAGEYHFSVGLFNARGVRRIADNDGWNVRVTGTPTATPAAQTIPSDIPLSPPFSYGPPQAAVFSAEGTSVSGSQIASNSRPDVAAADVLRFYETRFPRAGWTIDASTVPSNAAGAFSLTATAPGTSGTRVCVVQYAAGVVHIFYGTLSS